MCYCVQEGSYTALEYDCSRHRINQIYMHPSQACVIALMREMVYATGTYVNIIHLRYIPLAEWINEVRQAAPVKNSTSR